MSRKPIFDAIRAARGKGFTADEVIYIDAMLDNIGVARGGEADTRRINAKGLALIKKWEGLKLTAYRCPAGVLTIGYGSTGPHVKQGMTITEARAEALLREDLDRFERGVARLAPKATDDQFAAMVSLAFNVGLGAFEKSTLLRLHNAGDHAGAAAQFPRWNRAGGRVLQGLVNRRAEEARLYRGQA